MALDYAGISIGILGCYVSGVFYAFYCNNVSNLKHFTFYLSYIGLECSCHGSLELLNKHIIN